MNGCGGVVWEVTSKPLSPAQFCLRHGYELTRLDLRRLLQKVKTIPPKGNVAELRALCIELYLGPFLKAGDRGKEESATLLANENDEIRPNARPLVAPGSKKLDKFDVEECFFGMSSEERDGIQASKIVVPDEMNEDENEGSKTKQKTLKRRRSEVAAAPSPVQTRIGDAPRFHPGRGKKKVRREDSTAETSSPRVTIHAPTLNTKQRALALSEIEPSRMKSVEGKMPNLRFTCCATKVDSGRRQIHR